MATENRRAEPTLEELLFDEPYRFEFFQAIRLLERLSPNRKLIGHHDNLPAEEVVRLRTRPTLQFPPSQIFNLKRDSDAKIESRANTTTTPDDVAGTDSAATVDTTTDGATMYHAGFGREPETHPERPPEMTVAFIGLIGSMGVLPSHITELVAERARYKDRALWEFLDLFNHRIGSLFYRAWERHRFHIAFERGAHDSFTEHLFDLIGMGTRGLRGRMNMPDQGLLLYSGLISQRPHSATALASIIGDYFRVPAQVEQFAGQWLDLDADSLCRLGVANSQLGFGTIAGARVWDVVSKFRVRLGAMTLDEFNSLIPSGVNFRRAVELTRFIAGAELDFDLQLTLKRNEVPACILGGANTSAAPRLGWTTWLKTQPFAHDDSQVVLNP